MTLMTPGGKISAASSARILSVVTGVVSAGFRTSVLPVASAGPIFQIGHHQRVVPGGDLADHADRLAADVGGVVLHVLARGAPFHVARGAGEEAQLVRPSAGSPPRTSPAAACRRPGLAVGDLLGPLLDRVGELQQQLLALARRRVLPRSRTPRAPPSRRGRRPPRWRAARCAITSPVAGLITSSVLPSAGSTNSPSMKFFRSWTSVAVRLLLLRRCGGHLLLLGQTFCLLPSTSSTGV